MHVKLYNGYDFVDKIILTRILRGLEPVGSVSFIYYALSAAMHVLVC